MKLILEITLNIKCKQEKYTDGRNKRNILKSVEFINLSISTLGIFDKELSAFLKMLNRLDVSETQTKYCIKKMINIIFVLDQLTTSFAVATKSGRILI